MSCLVLNYCNTYESKDLHYLITRIMNNKRILVALTALVATIGLAGVAASAQNNTNLTDVRTRVETALVSKNLTDWKSASKELANSEIDATTQEQLNTKSDRYTAHKAVDTAITNNDYEAFKKSADERMLTRVTSQADFDKLVADKKAKTEYQIKVAETIKNNDFNAFKELSKNKPTRTLTDGRGNDNNRPTPTDEQFQTRFNEMVAQYKADGSLPTDDKGFGMGGHGKGFGGRGMK
jgi:hypothetical protein